MTSQSSASFASSSRNNNNINNNGSPVLPSAPYPPNITRYPSTQLSSLRSSLSSSPHYSRSDTPNQMQEVDGDGRFKPAPFDHRHAKIRFCPSNNQQNQQQLACINCLEDPFGKPFPETQLPPPPPTSADTKRPKLKKGPTLLELRRLCLNQEPLRIAAPSETESTAERVLFYTETIAKSRGNPSLGSSVASTCLDVLPPSDNGSSNSLSSSHAVVCATGLTTGALCLHSFSASDDNNDNGIMTSSIEYFHTPRSHRPATAVQFCPAAPHHVALGWTAESSSSGSAVSATSNRREHRGMPSAPPGLATATVPTAPAAVGARAAGQQDREYGCVVWDVVQQQTTTTTSSTLQKRKSTPLYKLAHQVGVASLAWVHGGSTLAVGSQSRHLQLYDLRQSAPPQTTYAHNYGVHGIAVDPTSDGHALFATFSRTAQEPVKLWDARRMEAPVSEIKVTGKKRMVTAMQWSRSSPWSLSGGSSILSLAVGDAVYDYDTRTGRPLHTQTVHARQAILDFCLYPSTTTATANTPKSSNDDGVPSREESVTAQLSKHRMLIAQEDRSVVDQSRHAVAPVALSHRDGRLVHGLAKTLWVGSTAEGPAAMEALQIHASVEDVSATMMRRARCLHVAKYSMDTRSNIKMLAQDGLVADGPPLQQRESEGPSPTRDALLRLWTWIERVEDLCNQNADNEHFIPEWSAKTLMDAGVWNLARLDSSESEMETYSEALACSTYDSPGRRTALTACGWAGKFDLSNVLGECEDLGEYERSAALAVWHGDLEAAVEALQRGAAFLRSPESRRLKQGRVSSEYAELLELVSMSIAGYRGGDSDKASSRMWNRACANLMQRLSSSQSSNRQRLAYLRSVLKFLMTINVDEVHREVLDDDDLSLCDRVAFACNFLSRKDLKNYLQTSIDACRTNGNVEGLAVTGLGKQGITILQSYVDRYSDVQTAALVTSRVIFPQDKGWDAVRQISAEWLDAYRTLLNTWQMWQSRAMFDVDRATLLRTIKQRQAEQNPPHKPGVSTMRRAAPPSRRPRQPDPDVQASVPAQLDARCNYCSSSLGLRSKQDANNQASTWLSRMKPVLSCCPTCRKPLPRCSICMLSLGALNPYMELTSKVKGVTGSLPFAEWFSWCLRCKHGGHAHHLVGWFANHEVCPVSGCECRCQFDGIQKLNRPALSQAAATSERSAVEGISRQGGS